VTDASPVAEMIDLLPYLTDEERAQLDALLTVDMPLWEPASVPQRLAYDSPADELFYGGAAGGGKSDLLLGLSITAHRKAVIFRREYENLKEIEERAREIIGEAGQYNSQRKIWKLNDGRRLDFGAVQFDHDKRKWRGRPHDLKGFDELTEFTQSQYEFIIGWARSTTPGQRVRVVATGNPPESAEGEWVIQRWGAWLDPQHPKPARPGELRWYAMVDGKEQEVETGEPFEWNDETIQPKSRTFIPARLADNPFLATTGYEAILQNMPEPLRSQLLFGDFKIGREDNVWQVIPTEWVRLAQERWEQRTADPDFVRGPLTAIGADVARGGGDKFVLAPRFANYFGELEKHEGKTVPDGQTGAGLVVRMLRDLALVVEAETEGEEKAEDKKEALADATVNVDLIGVGTSVYDFLHEMDGVDAQGVNVASGADQTDRSGKFKMRNVRAWMYWSLREALDPQLGEDLALPPDSELLADLCAPRWKVSAQGIQVESKEDIIERLGRSPDSGDAVALAHLETSTWLMS